MLMSTKLVTLDLSYSCEMHKVFQQHRHYIAPYQGESAEHFGRRLLAYLILYEQSPVWNNTSHTEKLPDLYLKDDCQRYTLWAAVEPLTGKGMRRALHQADRVILFLSEQQTDKIRHYPGDANVGYYQFSDAELAALTQLLRPHMQLSVWRELDTLNLTDGCQLVNILLQNRYGASLMALAGDKSEQRVC